MKSTALLSALIVAIAMMVQSPNSHAQARPAWQDHGGTLVTDPSCVGFGLGEVVCAAVGAGGTLIVNRFDGTNWLGFEDLGGIVVRKPSCARWGIIPVLCAVIDAQSRVQVNIYNGQAWSGFQLLGGQSISEPACVGTAFLGFSATHCAIIGVNSALFVNTFNGTQWSGFKSLGGSYIYNPTCTQDWTFAGVFCAAVTIGAQLEGWKNVSGSTGAWVKMPQAVGTQVTADPNCSGIGQGKILCAVRSGTRLKVNRADDASTWPQITDLGGILMGAPGCMPNLHPLLGTPTATCAVRDTYSGVQTITFDGSTWSGYQVVHGVNTVGQPSCTFVGQTQKLCGVRGTNNHLYTLFMGT